MPTDNTLIKRADVQVPTRRRILDGQRREALRITNKLVREGTVTRGMSEDEIRVAFLAELESSAEGRAMLADPSLDWKALFELVLKYLPIILAIFGVL